MIDWVLRNNDERLRESTSYIAFVGMLIDMRRNIADAAAAEESARHIQIESGELLTGVGYDEADKVSDCEQ